MALKSFTASRAPATSDAGRGLASWHLSAGGTALIVNFCEEVSGDPQFQVQVPINTSASQSYAKPLRCEQGGRWHVEIVSGALNRGAIDIV